MTAEKPSALARIVTGLPLAVLSPLLILVPIIVLSISDLLHALFHRRKLFTPNTPPSAQAASIVIPNWNGKDLLEKYLPSVIEAANRVPGSEVIVVENGSEDGSAEYVRQHFPTVRLIALNTNLGFGGGSNAGFRAANNDVVVLLNSDMRVQPDFLAPLLNAFTDENIFSVSCQIFFSDPEKRREETGLTQGWWERGSIRVRHRIDPAITDAYPCFYGGGGSCAYDRRKFMELGGFDELLAPFYLEDTDLGYLAWKRGWKNLYQPQSIVFHEHRGTIGRKFSRAYIDGVLKKNYLLFTWKNIHSWGKLAEHFLYTWAGAIASWLIGDSPQRASLPGLARAFLQLPGTCKSRSHARTLSMIDDAEALRRPLGGYFQDRFGHTGPIEKPRVLFIAPYPICPPVHGGAVFMYQTVRELAKRVQLHLIVLLELESQRAAHQELLEQCASVELKVRGIGPASEPASITPHAVHEFQREDIQWLIHREIFIHKIDVLQIEYTMMGQYGAHFKRIPAILFEHDVYFQSIARRIPGMDSFAERMTARWEYLRALRHELRLLRQVDRIQVCSHDNAEYLLSFLPALKGKIDEHYRAGIDSADYSFKPDGREPNTLLFLGSFRHLPNQEALEWFAREVLPRVVQQIPETKLVLVGSDPPARHHIPQSDAIDFRGFVDDIREPLARYSVFVCPILSGSGVRVKLLEAFAAGIPVVSTYVGAEGLAHTDGEICALAGHAETFAQHIVELLRDSQRASAMAHRAREYVVSSR